MSILSDKQTIFGDIAAAKTLVTGLPSLKTNSSFPSINNDGNSINFLCDLLKSLIGGQAFINTISDTLTYSLTELERQIKSTLKTEIKSIVNCGINPSLPSFMKSIGMGVNLTVPQVDFTNLFFINPNSVAGMLLYNDLKPNLIDSSDFNTFLYQTIQNNGTTENWGNTTKGQDILSFQFNQTDINGINPNNTLNVRANGNYDAKSLTDLNNDFVDSITLFNTQDLFTRLIESSFGTISNATNKSLKQLENEAKINTVITKISHSNSNDVINSSYFTFTKTETALHQSEAIAKKAGVKTVTTTGKINTSIPLSSVQDMNTSISSATNMVDKKTAVDDSLNQIGNVVGSATSNQSDQDTVKMNFIQELINNLINVITSSILSPRVVVLFVLNYKIIYGPTATYSDVIDFLQKNKNLIHDITKKITNLIVNILLKLALKEIKSLVSDYIVKQQIDKNKANLTQLLSLLGVPQDTLRIIQGI